MVDRIETTNPFVCDGGADDDATCWQCGGSGFIPDTCCCLVPEEEECDECR